MVAISACAISDFVGLAVGGSFGVGMTVTGSGVGFTIIGSLETEGRFSALLLHARSVKKTHNAIASRLVSLATILLDYSAVSWRIWSSVKPISIKTFSVCSPKPGATCVGSHGVPSKSQGVEIMRVDETPSGTSTNKPASML